MRMRQVIGVAAVAVLALVAGACGGDDEKADDTTTTTAKEETTTTLTDEDYSSAIAEYTASVEAAGTDLCALSQSLTSTPPTPATEAQSKQLIELYAKLLRTLAAAVPSDPTSAQTFTSTADALLAEAEEAGYPVDFLSNVDDPPTSLSGEAFATANQAVAAKVQTDCAPATTAVEGTEETTTTVAG